MPANNSLSQRAIAAQQFHQARRRAAMQELLARFSGRSTALLSYGQVVNALRVRGQSSVGLQQVPVEAIIGSVGRSTDFTRTFLPLQDTDQDRWVSVKTAAPHVGDLPPVELYRIGNSYFVLDGNHRVSIARQQELDFIDAFVTEIHTRVPLPPGAQPDALIIAAEHGAFLEWSRLDELRPDADLRVSVPGQYIHLENHIEAFRYLAEVEEGRELDDQTAILRWYDEAYLPLVEAIREQGILRYFPGRTETDFFIWLARHRVELENELGWRITPEVAVSRLLSRIEVPAAEDTHSVFSRIRRRLTRIVVSNSEAVRVAQSWSQMRTMARYTDRLFADILLPVDVVAGFPSMSTVQQAFALAIEEDARLCVVTVVPQEPIDDAHAQTIAQLEAEVGRRAEAIDLRAGVVVEAGDVVQVCTQMALLNDLVVLDREFGVRSGQTAPSPALLHIVQQAHRPIMIAGSQGDRPVTRRVLVAINGQPQSREALFIAAYLAEQWQVELIVQPFGSGRAVNESVAHAQDYFAMHELRVEFAEPIPSNGIRSILEAGAARDCDLLIVADFSSSARREHLSALIDGWSHSLLIAS